jgi:Sortase domain
VRELRLAAALVCAAAAAGCGGAEVVVQPPAVFHEGRAAPKTRAARPERLLIPALGVSARLETLGLRRDGRLAPPRDPDRPGWWSGGPRPGRPGAAVIAGHVDSRAGPAVFARLARLRRGDRIVVVDRAGRRLRFAVQAVEQHPKNAFPTQRVYGRTRGPALRLITCSGAFDRGSGHYRSNLVVFAAPRLTARAAP